MVEDRSADLLADRQDLDKVLVYPRRALSRALEGVPQPVSLARATRAFLRTLRETRYDAVLDLQGNLKSGAVTRAARAEVRLGFSRRASREGNHLFTGRRFDPPAAMRHRVELGLGLASAFLGRSLPYVPPGFPVGPTAQASAASLIEAAGLPAEGYVVLHPGTSGFGSFKRWAPDRFGALAGQLVADGLPVVITHGPGEEALAEAVERGCPAPVARIAPPSFSALAEVIRRARLFVAGDTGPLHLAGLVGTPLVGLFGPKDPAVYGPYGVRPDGAPGVLATHSRDDVACRPCPLRKCADPICMGTIEPEDVYAAVRQVIA